MRPVLFSHIDGWPQDNHKEAFEAFCASARHMVDVKPYKTRALKEDATLLVSIAKRALQMGGVDQSGARSFFETQFEPRFIKPDNCEHAGFMTGFFEPQMEASLTQSPEFPVPLYARPPQLVDLNDSNRPQDWGSDWRYGWGEGGALVQAPDRGEIDKGLLAHRGLEIAWMRNKVDAFFVHVQGAAKLLLVEGGFMRVTYAGKTGHPYTSLGRLLCKRLGVTLAEMTSDVLRDWMLNNPDQLDALLANNRSYIFFKKSPANGDEGGPIAAAKVPLTRHRSLAVDRSLHTFGVPFFVSTHKPLPGEDQPFQKLMVAHDTGSAITGKARGDIFCGTGEEAGIQAGRIQHAADMIVLMPKGDGLS